MSRGLVVAAVWLLPGLLAPAASAQRAAMADDFLGLTREY